jgi:regulator of protease activity HflC (stomatin/prohibitin superfamily)
MQVSKVGSPSWVGRGYGLKNSNGSVQNVSNPIINSKYNLTTDTVSFKQKQVIENLFIENLNNCNYSDSYNNFSVKLQDMINNTHITQLVKSVNKPDEPLYVIENDDIGISLINITIQDAEPPTKEVMEAFKAVETAKQGKETAINNANKYRNEKIPAAEAQVDKILQDAEATKQERINEANGQVSRFNKMYDEYKKFPDVTKERMFYETMEEVLPNLKVIINSGNTTVQELLPIDSFTSETTNTNTTQEGEN